MELRLLELAIRILDPRKWRTRVAQVGGSTFALLWIWYRSVDRLEVDRAVRDARWDARRTSIRERRAATERARLSGSG